LSQAGGHTYCKVAIGLALMRMNRVEWATEYGLRVGERAGGLLLCIQSIYGLYVRARVLSSPRCSDK